MFQALVPLQRADGFWNVSLKDSTHFGGKELTGTALFTYSMAWSINNGLISKKEYLSVVMKAWNAIITASLHTDGSLGYVQGSGKEPKEGQPVTYENIPDSEDLGVGCFLLAGSEVYKLSKSMEPVVKPPKAEKQSSKESSKETSKENWSKEKGNNGYRGHNGMKHY
jgi:rhamnogalacturonyl hydrolase YesR